MNPTPAATTPYDRAATTTATAVVDGQDLHKHYGEGESLVRAVDGVDVAVARGEYVAIMGPSGCGKSPLLHVLGGLEHLTSGTHSALADSSRTVLRIGLSARLAVTDQRARKRRSVSLRGRASRRCGRAFCAPRTASMR